MNRRPATSLIAVERIEQRIYLIRGQKVMLDRDLSVLYGVATKVFNQAVKRHKTRFPNDFMFPLTWQEARSWRSRVTPDRSRSQFVTLNRGQNIKFRPRAFTEHGILMLSSVLNSERAVQVNIEIVRAFIRLRGILASHKDLARRLDELEMQYDAQFKTVFDAIRELMAPSEKPKSSIGFKVRSETG